MANFFDKTRKAQEPTAEVLEEDSVDDFAGSLQAAAEQQATEIEEMDEALRRTIKANKYMEVAQMELFNDDEEPEAYEVEEEIRAFAKERLRVYLGMRADTTPSKAKDVIQAKLPFSEKQVQVLIGWADSLIARPKLATALAPPARGRPVEAVPTTAPASAQTTQEAQSNPEPASGRRPRGRPPGTGKHQRAAARVQPTAAAGTPAPLQKPLTGDAEIDPDNGKPFVWSETHDDHGNTVKKKHYVQDQTAPAGIKPMPWPSGHSPLENMGGVDAIRVSNGYDDQAGATAGGRLALSGNPLSQAIKHFSR